MMGVALRGPPAGSIRSVRPSTAGQPTGTRWAMSQNSPRAHATWQTMSSSATAETGAGVFAPKLHHLQNPPPPPQRMH